MKDFSLATAGVGDEDALERRLLLVGLVEVILLNPTFSASWKTLDP